MLEGSHSPKKLIPVPSSWYLLISLSLVLDTGFVRVFVGKRIKGGQDAQRKKFLFIGQVLILVRVVTLFLFLVHVWWCLKCDFRSSIFTAVLGGRQHGVICSTVILYSYTLQFISSSFCQLVALDMLYLGIFLLGALCHCVGNPHDAISAEFGHLRIMNRAF